MFSAQQNPHLSIADEINEKLRLGSLLVDKCELKEARRTVEQALEMARSIKDVRGVVEALSILLRLASEALDYDRMKALELEIDGAIRTFGETEVPSVVWWCKGIAARYQGRQEDALALFLRHLTRLKARIRSGKFSNPYLTEKQALGRAWSRVAVSLFLNGKTLRAEVLAHGLLKRLEKGEFEGIEGYLSNLLATIFESRKEVALSEQWYQKAMKAYLSERNWYSYLYVLLGQSRLARVKKEYAQSYWYLDLIDKAVAGDEAFGDLNANIRTERDLLAQDAVDLLIDSRKAMIVTREKGKVVLGKQFVLLDILEALSEAHRAAKVDDECGLSKAQIIEKVWGQKYRPHHHDNKLYYNINRLRKLIEPDVHRPQYLQNWKEGYRLAPGLKIQWHEGTRAAQKGESA